MTATGSSKSERLAESADGTVGLGGTIGLDSTIDIATRKQGTFWISFLFIAEF
jgi:hypothetical protein